jgi:hypothetical protein
LQRRHRHLRRVDTSLDKAGGSPDRLDVGRETKVETLPSANP